ncbi:hypothetical protein CC80DRAFT_532447 [Byssothecium circinans]|uniref:Uncharacterized protein n=1 Tax=Byssothecium circinans TaxID=147558 RepID=A0A6A5UAC6_9PLEO|nr:hypothetical protein CC80DRAFT_532447 [Byssothecium circinans]
MLCSTITALAAGFGLFASTLAAPIFHTTSPVLPPSLSARKSLLEKTHYLQGPYENKLFWVELCSATDFFKGKPPVEDVNCHAMFAKGCVDFFEGTEGDRKFNDWAMSARPTMGTKCTLFS